MWPPIHAENEEASMNTSALISKISYSYEGCCIKTISSLVQRKFIKRHTVRYNPYLKIQSVFVSSEDIKPFSKKNKYISSIVCRSPQII